MNSFFDKSFFRWISHKFGGAVKSVRLGLILGLVLAIALILGGAVLAVYHLFIPISWATLRPVQEKSIMIPYGSNAAQVARILYQEGLIEDEGWFRAYARLQRSDRKLRTGFFSLSTGQSLHHILAHLTQKASGTLLRVTIPEGVRLTEIGRILESKGLVSQKQFVAFSQTAKPIFSHRFQFLESIPTSNLEGYLFPDTYFFSQGEDLSTIVGALLQQFDRKLIQDWQTSTSSVKTLLTFHQALTLASIVEKEAIRPSEMPIIASVFFNRLKIHMPLASDPTVIYALGYATKPIVTYSDLTFVSPYNTYRVQGLPPTPIASPGERAFKAVLNPKRTPYLFFVSDQNGGHIFTTSYRQHLDVQMMLSRKLRDTPSGQ